MTNSSTDPLIGRLIDGRYEVRARIARGGMATVYLAVDRRLDREVALKVMHPHLAEGASGADFVARFRREAKSAARLTHPGLVGVYDQGMDGETSYLALEYVAGSNLRDQLVEQGSLTVGRTLEVLAAVLEALSAVHLAGLVHRDIKPENVLITTDGVIKVGDFGLARAVTEVTATTTGTILGTVAYLAPELVSRGISDARTDIYACGVLLYEMLTGRQPFTGLTPVQVAFQHVNTDVPAPSEQDPLTPGALDELVTLLCSRDASNRPADARTALEQVRRVRQELSQAQLDFRLTPPIVATADSDPQDSDDVLVVSGSAAGNAPEDETTDGDDTELDVPDFLTNSPAQSHETELLRYGGSGRTVALPLGVGLQDSGEVVPVAELVPHEEAPTKRRWWLIALLFVVAAAAGVGTYWWYQNEGPGSFTTVPDVTDGTAEQAIDTLQLADLRGTTVTQFDDSPPGTVLGTDPGTGEEVKRDSEVTVQVSQGPDYRAVPADLIGLEVSAAVDALEEAGFSLLPAERKYDDDAPTGTVMNLTTAQGVSVSADQEFVVGTELRLTVSDGPEPVTVISVVGATVSEAEEQLGQLGLKALVTTEKHHDTVEAGAIISQNPVSGNGALRGDTVELVVSKGPVMVEVPELRNLSEDEALAKLSEVGLYGKAEPGYLGIVFDRVYSQDVSAGTPVREGSTITFVVM